MKKSKYVVSYICFGVLVFFMLTVFVRIFTRQVLIKKLHVDNGFTRIVFYDDAAMQTTTTSTIDWAKLYPFKEDAGDEAGGDNNEINNSSALISVCNTLDAKIDNVEGKVDKYTSTELVGYSVWTICQQIYRLAINWGVSSDVLRMDNGYLINTHKRLAESDIEEVADSVQEFNEYLSEKGISFYYINAGSKVNPDDKELSGYALLNEFSNENADDLLRELNFRGVSTVDMRKLMKKDGLDWYQSYYVTDHHWTTRTGLWCAKKIAELLNENDGFKYDLELFDESSYSVIKYENFWYGVQARKLNLVGCSKDSFEVFIPKFKTKFEVSIPTRNLNASGTYEEVMIDESLLESIREYGVVNHFNNSGPYESAVWRNDALGEIKNFSVKENSDKKILILQDSFGFYSSPFLACDTGEIDIINTSKFDGSIREYVNQTNPDVVIIMLSEGSITKIDWNSHGSKFDLR